jgi:hypothetical protein
MNNDELLRTIPQTKRGKKEGKKKKGFKGLGGDFVEGNQCNGHKQTRCVIHNGPAINLISTIDIYDKLVMAIGNFFFKNVFLMYIMLL